MPARCEVSASFIAVDCPAILASTTAGSPRAVVAASPEDTELPTLQAKWVNWPMAQKSRLEPAHCNARANRAGAAGFREEALPPPRLCDNEECTHVEVSLPGLGKYLLEPLKQGLGSQES
mmetsp:Transcript_108263/g.231161  ORF Transcript_108263/g.231161 Transcript_108263/m.231161 type:complete len:120 (+) Transcript_108263:932-1291(+)